jgi:hypothetical protein
VVTLQKSAGFPVANQEITVFDELHLQAVLVVGRAAKTVVTLNFGVGINNFSH